MQDRILVVSDLVLCDNIQVTDEKPLMLYLAYFLSDLNK
jgi:hypothetical protein